LIGLGAALLPIQQRAERDVIARGDAQITIVRALSIQVLADERITKGCGIHRR
jgi:hypothetical protein